MYICNYCNRVLKEEYEKCPGCGGSSFKTKAFLGDVIIKEPPKGGYKLNTKNFEKSLNTANIFIIIGLFLIIFPVISALPFLLLGSGITNSYLSPNVAFISANLSDVS